MSNLWSWHMHLGGTGKTNVDSFLIPHVPVPPLKSWTLERRYESPMNHTFFIRSPVEAEVPVCATWSALSCYFLPVFCHIVLISQCNWQQPSSCKLCLNPSVWSFILGVSFPIISPPPRRATPPQSTLLRYLSHRLSFTPLFPLLYILLFSWFGQDSLLWSERVSNVLDCSLAPVLACLALSHDFVTGDFASRSLDPSFCPNSDSNAAKAPNAMPTVLVPPGNPVRPCVQTS